MKMTKAQLEARVVQLEKENYQLHTVIATAYQVVGSMAHSLGVFGTKKMQGVLDKFSNDFSKEILPFENVRPRLWVRDLQLEQNPNRARYADIKTPDNLGRVSMVVRESEGVYSTDIHFSREFKAKDAEAAKRAALRYWSKYLVVDEQAKYEYDEVGFKRKISKVKFISQRGQ